MQQLDFLVQPELFYYIIHAEFRGLFYILARERVGADRGDRYADKKGKREDEEPLQGG